MSKRKRKHNGQPIHQEPPIRNQSPPLTEREEDAPNDRRFWPKGKERPKCWRKSGRQLLPCPNCNRVLLDDLGQAVVCSHSRDRLAYFRCKACGHRWKLAVLLS